MAALVKATPAVTAIIHCLTENICAPFCEKPQDTGIGGWILEAKGNGVEKGGGFSSQVEGLEDEVMNGSS
ncbi:hypothetical protein GCM10027021_15550 [Dyella kyungheensis]|jgi:hypothetical protein